MHKSKTMVAENDNKSLDLVDKLEEDNEEPNAASDTVERQTNERTEEMKA